METTEKQTPTDQAKITQKSLRNGGFCSLKMQKYTKNTKKTQKNAKIFAHIKKKYYLCIEIKKQTNQRWRQQ